MRPVEDMLCGLAAKIDEAGRHAPAPRPMESQQKPLGLNAQQLAAVGRHSPQQAGQPAQILGDARALQTMLKRIFDFDGGKSRPATARALETAAGRLALDGPTPLPAGENATARSAQPASTPTGKAGHPLPVEATEAALRHEDVEGSEKATPAAKREDVPVKAQVANAAGQALARSILQAVARDMTPALLMPAVAQMLENLTPEEANFIRSNARSAPRTTRLLPSSGPTAAKKPKRSPRPARPVPHRPKRHPPSRCRPQSRTTPLRCRRPARRCMPFRRRWPI